MSECLNVTDESTETDLIVWDSGEAEFVTVDSADQVVQTHFDDLTIGELRRLLEQIGTRRPTA